MIEKTQEEIMSSWIKKDLEHPLLSIKCITYNQEKFISKTLDSFLEQVTTFVFEVIVHDDASIDTTANIIKEYEKKYPKIIKPIYEEENQYSKNDGTFTKIINSYIKGKYVAICEGDDYWIDPNKLQMQVDFLENHPDYGMCASKVKRYNQITNSFSEQPFGKEVDNVYVLLNKLNILPTTSVVYKYSTYLEYIKDVDPFSKHWLMGDYPLNLYFSIKSKIQFFDKTTAVYRVLEESACHFTDYTKEINFINSIFNIQDYFVNKYNLDYKTNKFSFLVNHFINKMNFTYNPEIAKIILNFLKKEQNKNLKTFFLYIKYSNRLTFEIFTFISRICLKLKKIIGLSHV